jgi:cobalt-zinc-cadmium resistance protein CzcA
MRPSGKKLSTIFLLLGIASFSHIINGQETKLINVHDAIQTALDSNLSIKSAAYSAGASRALKGAALDLPKTIIDGQYGQFNSFTNDNSFTVSQSFAFPSVYINRFKLANANIKKSELQYKISQLEVATQVKQIYWQYVYLTAKQKLLAYQDTLYTGFLRAAELRAKSGETNKLEMITARSQSLEIKNQLFQTTADIGIFRRKLKTILNSRTPIVPSEIVLHKIDFPFLTDSLTVEHNPSLIFAQQQVEVSQIEKRLERNLMLPDLNIGYFSQTITGTQDVNGVARNFGKDFRFTGVQAGISIPLWFTPYSSRVKAARINESIAQTDAESFYTTINSNYQTLLDEYAKYSSSIEYYETQAVPEADMIIDQATKSYKAGALDYLEYVMTLNRALDIRQSYLEALNNCNQTIISIEYITGKIF